MRKVILMMLLAAVSSSAMAEWVKLGSSKDGNAVFFANPATIRKNGSKATMWHLYDLKSAMTVSGVKFLSSNMQWEYDCKEEQYRWLIDYWYSKNMGGGNLVYTNSNTSKWEPVVPSDLNYTLLKLACGKR